MDLDFLDFFFFFLKKKWIYIYGIALEGEKKTS